MTIASVYSAVSSSTLILDSSWLKDPADPFLSCRVTVRALEPVVSGVSQSVFYPLGAAFPIVVSGPRQASQGSITLLITTQAELDALNLLLTPTRTLLFQKPVEPTASTVSPVTSVFLQVVGEVSIARLAQPADRPHREVTFSYVEVAAP